MVNRFVQFLTSLKLTVACLAVSMVLVFIGTLAQVDEGLYAAQERYFKSFLIYLEPAAGNWRIPVFPGGYLVGVVLLVNLLAAHGKRFRITKKKFGIFLIHAGLILLLLGQLFTDILSQESALEFEEGESKNYTVDFRKNELTFIDRSDPETDRIISIPESRIREGVELRDSPLPFTVKVRKYWPNSEILGKSAEGAVDPKADQGPAQDFFVQPLDPVTEMNARDLPSAVVELIDGDQSLGTWLTSAVLKPQRISHNGKDYDLVFRFKRYYEPFSLTLLKASHDNYKGTEVPKNFSSRVRIQNETSGEDREVLVYMNHPLRYGGLTFYQFQMMADQTKMQPGMIATSTLQVVRNPTWLTPYLACIMVGAGLLLQFMTHLIGFLRKHHPQKASSETEQGNQAKPPSRSALKSTRKTNTKAKKPSTTADRTSSGSPS